MYGGWAGQEGWLEVKKLFLQSRVVLHIQVSSLSTLPCSRVPSRSSPTEAFALNEDKRFLCFRSRSTFHVLVLCLEFKLLSVRIHQVTSHGGHHRIYSLSRPTTGVQPPRVFDCVLTTHSIWESSLLTKASIFPISGRDVPLSSPNLGVPAEASGVIQAPGPVNTYYILYEYLVSNPQLVAFGRLTQLRSQAGLSLVTEGNWEGPVTRLAWLSLGSSAAA